MVRSKLKTYLQKYKDMSPAVKAALWFTISNIIQKGISFITMPIFTRIMSTEDYGIYTVYNSWYSIITIFATLNLSSFVFSKGMVKYKEDRDKFEVSMQSLNITLTLGMVAIYMIFRNSINLFVGLSTTIMLLMFLQIAIEPSIQYWTARNRFEFEYKKVVAVTLGIALGNPILGIFMVLFSEDAALARVLSIVIVTAVFGCVIIFKLLKNAKTVFSVKYWKYALSFNLPLIPHFLSASILNQSDRIMIANMVGNSEAAIYSVAYSVAMVPMLLSTAIQQSFLPWLYTKLSKGDSRKISAVTDVTLLLMMGVVLGIISFGPEVIRIVAPSDYYLARWIVPSVCGSAYFVFLHNMFANIEYYFEETKKIAVASVAVAGLNILLNYIFIKKYGFIAAGYTTIFCYIIYTISHYYVMKYICKKHNFTDKLFNIKRIVITSAAFLLLIGILTVVYDLWYVRYGVVTILFAILILKKNKILELAKTFKDK